MPNKNNSPKPRAERNSKKGLKTETVMSAETKLPVVTATPLPKFPAVIMAAMAVLLVFGAYLVFNATNTNSNIPTNSTTFQTSNGDITFQGQDGKSAMALLKEKYQVETKQYDFGEFIVSVNGQKPAENEYWIYYVNGQPGTTGADAYITKSTDIITWRIEKAQ